MVRVVPFKGYRYNKEKISDLSKVVSPPYDIIKGELIHELHGLSDYNISWIIKNQPRDDDTDSGNQYTRAAELLNKWIEDEILIQDVEDSFYIYGQNFEIDNERKFRFGFIGLIELEEFAKERSADGKISGVLQHEETLPKDIIDRLSLCREAMAQFGQIFVIYPDHERQVDTVLENHMKSEPVIDVVDRDGVRHRIWRLVDANDIDRISEIMREKYVIIADGHHRYKTALQLSKENPDLEAAKYRMLTFVNIYNPGVVVLPTHRLIQNLDDFSGEKLLREAEKHFEIKAFDEQEEMFSLMTSMFEQEKHSFGLFMDDGRFYTLTLEDPSAMEQALPNSSDELHSLDVSILHSLILDKILGIDKEKLAQGTMKGGGFVVYIKGHGDAVDESIRSVKEGAQAVFFMNPTRVDEVEAVSKNLECMPQKSTFFQPKVWTGFTINVLKKR